MESLSIANAAPGLDGIEFTTFWKGVEQKFVLYRDGLEDLEFKLFETDDELMQAFTRHRAHIAEVARKALDEGKGGAKPVVLQTLIL